MYKLSALAATPSRLVVLIMLVSVLLRLGSALYMGDTVVEQPGTSDQLSYHALAQRVLAGHGFSFGEDWWPATAAGEPTAHWSYLYTFFLAGVYALFGPHAIAARVIQAVLVGGLQPFLTYRIGSRLFGRPAGMVAAALSAVYAYFIYYAGALMTEPFYILAILLVVDISTRLAAEPASGKRPGLWLALGLSMSAAVLLRQVFLLMVPIVLIWVAWALWYRQRTLPLLQMALPLVVLAAAILPFSLYNSTRFGSTVLLNTNAGFAFFWGNHPYYGTDFQPILPTEVYRQLIPAELLGLDEAALDKALLERAGQFIIQDPGRYLLLSLSRIPDFFQFWPSADSGVISNISRVISFGLLWPFMLAGSILALWKTRGPLAAKAASPVFLLVLFALLYSGVHLLTWALIRYRLPVDAVLLVFAAALLVELDQRVFHLRRRIGTPGRTRHSLAVPER